MTDSDRDLIIKEIKVLIETPCGDSSEIESESNQDLSGATVNRSTSFGWNGANQRPDPKISYSLFPVEVITGSKFREITYSLEGINLRGFPSSQGSQFQQNFSSILAILLCLF